MKSNPRHDSGATRLLALSAWLVCAFLLVPPDEVRASPNDELNVDRAQMPTPSSERLRKARRKGPVFLAIPLAHQYGMFGHEGGYCSPSVRATNSSNETIEELIVGIDYMTTAGKPAGATVTRYAELKIREQKTDFFLQLAVSECRGLEGRVSIVRCVYSTGEDCSAEIQPVGFGAIPLRLKSR